MANLQPIPRLAPAIVENRLAEWRRLLRGSTTQGRTVLQRVLCGRLTFTPRVDGEGYNFSGPHVSTRLFTGIVARRPDPEAGNRLGLEHIGAKDTLDGDYGRLPDRAATIAPSAKLRKGVRPHRDSNPGFGLERATS